MKLKRHEIHLQQVSKLQESLKNFSHPLSLKKNSASNTLRNGDYKNPKHLLDFTPFDGILAFNPEEKWIVVEPRITFKKLCECTLPLKLVPPVVPEFSTITVGGAIMGTALESSSHRFGQVSDTCLEYEVLLGNGERTILNPQKNPDLFYALSGSFGTLALLTAIKMQLIEAKKWVRLNISRFNDLKEAISVLTAPQKADYIEGIVYSRTKALVVTGEMVEKPQGAVFRQNKSWSPWYAQHLLQSKNTEEFMPLEEYLFRLDRGGFWIGRYVNSFRAMSRLLFRLGIPKIETHSLHLSFPFRFLFGWAFSSQRLFQFWHRFPNRLAEQVFFIHDFYTPFAQAEKVLHRFINHTEIFPIWLCPIKGTTTGQFLAPHYGASNFLNIGFYGIPPNGKTPPDLSALLEKEIIEAGGRKMLYSFTYYDLQSFQKIYSEPFYSALRKKFYAEKAFPTLYEKVSRHPIS